MTLTLLRHGKIDPRYEKCYNGHIDISLSEAGLQEARLLGSRLLPQNFDRIYCSDLRRAKETLKAFYSGGAVLYTKELREKSWGRHEGMNYESISQLEKHSFENFYQWLKILDGEDYHLFIQRIRKFFFEYLPAQEGERFLIVTHAGVIRVLIHLLESISLEEAFSRKIDYGTFITYEIDSYLTQSSRL